jgi:hypothetical protein
VGEHLLPVLLAVEVGLDLLDVDVLVLVRAQVPGARVRVDALIDELGEEGTRACLVG